MTKSNRQAGLEQARTDQTFDAMQHYVDLHERSAPMAFVGRTNETRARQAQRPTGKARNGKASAGTGCWPRR